MGGILEHASNVSVGGIVFFAKDIVSKRKQTKFRQINAVVREIYF